ncbi:DUF4232 domain-containing protein [Rothia sp. P6271]|uniref:DUF4232 domain-containing protein n=1 Tax=Rothia sp. P6271 TaxID=3402659 RepID=UPI003AD649EF
MKIFSSPTTRFLPYLAIGLFALNACSQSPQHHSSAPTPSAETSSPASTSSASAPTAPPKAAGPNPTAESATVNPSSAPSSSESDAKSEENVQNTQSSAPAQEPESPLTPTQQPPVTEYSEPPVPRGTVITVPPEPPIAAQPTRGESNATSQSARPEPAVPAPASTAPVTASTPTCDYGHIRIDAQANPGAGAAGSRYISLTFSNTGTTPCSLSGYPGVNYVDANGHQIGASAVPAGEWTSSGKVLRSQESATAILRETRAGLYSEQMCQPTTAAGYRVHIPGTSNSLVLKFPAEACSNDSVAQLSIGQIGASSS